MNDFNALVHKLHNLSKENLTKVLTEAAPADQVKGKEKAPKAGKANPYSKHPFVGRLVGETEGIDEDLLSELTNEFIDFLALKDEETEKLDDDGPIEPIEPEMPPHNKVDATGRNVAVPVPGDSGMDSKFDGPYKFQSGAEFYYDRSEGKYFDKSTGSYVSQEDMMWHFGIRNPDDPENLPYGKEMVVTDDAVCDKCGSIVSAAPQPDPF